MSIPTDRDLLVKAAGNLLNAANGLESLNPTLARRLATAVINDQSFGVDYLSRTQMQVKSLAGTQQVAVPPTPASENPHQDYLARYWQLGYDGGDLEACSGDAPLIAYREGKSTRAQQVAVPQQPNNDEVICPSCCTQFRAIPVNVQRLILDAGFEPPFVAAPQPAAYVPLTAAEIDLCMRLPIGCEAWSSTKRSQFMARAIEQAVRGKT